MNIDIKTEFQEKNSNSWFKFRRWMIPTLMIIAVWSYGFVVEDFIFDKLLNDGKALTIKQELESLKKQEKLAFLVITTTTIGIIWLLIELFIWISKEKNYFICKSCGKSFYRDYQIEENVCKDCYKRNQI